MNYNGFVGKRYFVVFFFILIIISGLVWQGSLADSLGRIFTGTGTDTDLNSYQIQSNNDTMIVRAFPLNAITAREAKQTIYILVQDQRYNPIPNVEITLILRYPGGAEERYIVKERTNEDGFTHYTFSYNTEYVGNVLINVSATRGNLTSQTSTSFMIWW
jgi:hypothetical protein